MTKLNNLDAQNEIGIIGMGSMGGGMTLLFSQHGSRVGCFDVNKEMVHTALDRAKEDKDIDESLVHGYDSLEKLMRSFKRGQSRVLVISVPHGPAVDMIISQLEPLLTRGDIILDGGNEWWEDTERRQGQALARGVRYIGCGVSGGYQSARHGPSMSPGGDEVAFNTMKPLLEKWAAKTPSGEPCVRYIGPGGSGHYVKMIHNGIEQGFLSAIAESYTLLHNTLGFPNTEIAQILEDWNSSGELKGNYLIRIGAEILHFTRGNGVSDKHGIVNRIEDKVVQDVDNSEGTGTWTVKELSERHVAGPTIAAAHFLRIISSNKMQRLALCDKLQLPAPSAISQNANIDKQAWVEKIRLATYGALLASYIQGCDVIARQSKLRGWNINLTDCIHIWRAGCIIESEYISDLLQPFFKSDPSALNALFHPPIAKEFAKTYNSLKDVVRLALDTDAIVPALSATLEYMKSVGGKNLPNNFQEAEMDYFGHHNYDLKRERRYSPEIGAHHTEWKPA